MFTQPLHQLLAISELERHHSRNSAAARAHEDFPRSTTSPETLSTTPVLSLFGTLMERLRHLAHRRASQRASAI